MGVDFGIKSYQFGSTTRVKAQLWDQCGPERFRSITKAYYRGASVVLILVDQWEKYHVESIKQKIDNVKENSPLIREIVLVTTKKDLSKSDKRLLSNEDADLLAFEEFGGLHLDITNTKLDEPKIIMCYSTLMKFLTCLPIPRQ